MLVMIFAGNHMSVTIIFIEDDNFHVLFQIFLPLFILSYQNYDNMFKTRNCLLSMITKNPLINDLLLEMYILNRSYHINQTDRSCIF